jgi:hypothetical protein|tara:strand:+ start:235 stop:657 length:423 start_codon:yes stop_codon:yes gene_type:complete
MLEPIFSDIKLEWDWIKPQIKQILLEQPELTYRPEDVYASCVNGTAKLVTLDRNKFAVVEVNTDVFTHKKSLNVWVAGATEEGKSGATILTYTGFFEKFARECGCSYLECSTSKASLGRLYNSIGMSLKLQIYVKDLGET